MFSILLKLAGLTMLQRHILTRDGHKGFITSQNIYIHFFIIIIIAIIIFLLLLRDITIIIIIIKIFWSIYTQKVRETDLWF